MIWRIVSEYASLAKKKVRLSPQLTYALFDGLFQQGLLRQLRGDKRAASTLATDVEEALTQLVG